MEDFHEFRLQGIGGSDAPIIMGVSPWCTYDKLLEEKVSGIVEDQDNYATRHGKALEKPTLEEFEKRVDDLFAPTRMVSKIRPWLRANFDGANFDRSRIVEIKNPLSMKDHLLAKEGYLPPKYYPQCQHLIQVCCEAGFEVNSISYFSHYKSDYVLLEVPRDEAYIKTLMEKEQEFWNKVLELRKNISIS